MMSEQEQCISVWVGVNVSARVFCASAQWVWTDDTEHAKDFWQTHFSLCLNIHRISENPMTIIFYRHTSRKPYPHEHTHRETTVGFYSPCMREGNAAGGKKAVSLAQSRSNNCWWIISWWLMAFLQSNKAEHDTASSSGWICGQLLLNKAVNEGSEDPDFWRKAWTFCVFSWQRRSGKIQPVQSMLLLSPVLQHRRRRCRLSEIKLTWKGCSVTQLKESYV